jgi:hypothetical protein
MAGESVGPMTVGGIALALLAIALATAGTSQDRAAVRGLLLGLGSGVGFGLFFVALNATSPDSGLWPLLAAKVASVVVFGSLVLARDGAGEALWTRWGLIMLSGTTDMVANILFLLATRNGALSVSAVVVSLYPWWSSSSPVWCCASGLPGAKRPAWHSHLRQVRCCRASFGGRLLIATASLIGIASPPPFGAARDPVMPAVSTPMTSPPASTSGPPESPGWISTATWINPARCSTLPVMSSLTSAS